MRKKLPKHLAVLLDTKAKRERVNKIMEQGRKEAKLRLANNLLDRTNDLDVRYLVGKIPRKDYLNKRALLKKELDKILKLRVK